MPRSPSEVLELFSAGPKTGVFTDGACSGNPGPGGWGFVWVEEDVIRAEQCGYEPATTNNRMELMGLIAAYKALPLTAQVTVYSDSQICVNTINAWAGGWEARGWKRKTGPIANLALVQELWLLAKARPGVQLRWIRAHDGSRWNEYADALANYWMQGRP